MANVGWYALSLAACLSLAATCSGFRAAMLDMRRQATLHELTVSLVWGQLVFVTLAFAALVYGFVNDDFSIAYVANHSNSLLPWYYKVSAAWGGHEGSFLLWMLFLCLWMVCVVFRRENYPAPLCMRVLATLSLINLAFLCFSIFTSSPFERMIPMTPADGGDLNPQLQDFGLIVHPPMLYLGYVGLAVPFAFAVAGMLGNDVDTVWARWLRPWCNAAWAFLTCGIALGSWWAYYELGWGGWWFWDPAENSSFMPWLAATALVHSVAVTEKRGAFKSWTLLLAIAGFSLSLLGGFIIRSGVLTSVHAFAVDPERGLYILIFLAVLVGGSLALYASRAGNYRGHVSYTWLSREFSMLVNNGLMMLSLTVVIWGTLAPLVYEGVVGGRISIGPPFFNRFFVPFMLLLGVVLGLVPYLHWKRTSAAAIWQGVRVALPASLLIGLLVWAWFYPQVGVWLLAIGVAAWVSVTHVLDFFRRWRRGSLPLAYVGMSVAHIGFAMTLIGVAVTSTQSLEEDVRMAPGDVRTMGTTTFRFVGVSEVRGPNYVAQQGRFEIDDDGSNFVLLPEKRRYLAGGAVMTEAGIRAGFLGDIYISMGEPLGDAAWAIRLHKKPLVRWIWYGSVLMALGALVAIFDARYRRIRQRRAAPTTASDTVAAS